MPDHHRLIKMLSIVVLTLLLPACAASTGPHKRDAQTPTVDLFLFSVEAQRAYKESRWIDAVRWYQKIVEHSPQDAIALFQLANTYAQQGAFERAIYAYEQSLRYNPDQPKAWFNLSTAYLLNAQTALGESKDHMHREDPARQLIVQRQTVLQLLIAERFEEALVAGNALGK